MPISQPVVSIHNLRQTSFQRNLTALKYNKNLTFLIHLLIDVTASLFGHCVLKCPNIVVTCIITFIAGIVEVCQHIPMTCGCSSLNYSDNSILFNPKLILVLLKLRAIFHIAIDFWFSFINKAYL